MDTFRPIFVIVDHMSSTSNLRKTVVIQGFIACILASLSVFVYILGASLYVLMQLHSSALICSCHLKSSSLLMHS